MKKEKKEEENLDFFVVTEKFWARRRRLNIYHRPIKFASTIQYSQVRCEIVIDHSRVSNILEQKQTNINKHK